MPFLALDDVRLCYERGGVTGASPLLVINGSGTDLRTEPNPLSWPVVDRFDVLAYDHRGLGRSTPADAEAQPTMADFGRDAVALVDHAGWTTFAVVGISFGGMVAQEVALLAGDRVSRLVLACTSSGGAGGASYPLHELHGLPVDEFAERMVELLDTRAATDAELRSLFLAWLKRGDGDGEVSPGFRRQLEARRLHDTWGRLPSLRVPTLVAGGRYDGIAPPANAQALASRIPGAEAQLFDGGHAFFVQDPAAWPAMIEFLAA